MHSLEKPANSYNHSGLMQTREKLFRLTAWITHRHMMHHQRISEIQGAIGAWIMHKIAPSIYEHAEAAIGQQGELHELRALGVCFDMQHAAKLSGGWQDHHGTGLDQVANILVQQHDWDPEDVGMFVEQLTDGHFVFAHTDDDDDE